MTCAIVQLYMSHHSPINTTIRYLEQKNLLFQILTTHDEGCTVRVFCPVSIAMVVCDLINYLSLNSEFRKCVSANTSLHHLEASQLTI